MWGIGFPTSQQRGGTSVAKPQHPKQSTSKGVVWTHSYANMHPHKHTFVKSLLYTHSYTDKLTCIHSLFTQIYTFENPRTHTNTHTHRVGTSCTPKLEHTECCVLHGESGLWVEGGLAFHTCFCSSN